MTEPLKKSLLLRLGVAMATITTLAFIGMLSAVFTAETTLGSAGAINQAGSLRMQSYRIATDIIYSHNIGGETPSGATFEQVKEFDERLRSPRLTTVLVNNRQLQSVYDDLVQKWEQQIEPTLNVYITAKTETAFSGSVRDHLDETLPENILHRYLSIVDSYVADIDRFVKLLEEDTESKIWRLRLVQIVTLFLTLAVVFVTMYLMHTQVLGPLRELLGCAESARRGDFSVRTNHVSDDELGQLGYAFNVMAEDLSKMYADLEARVQKKTADLERSNRSLELLYNTIRHLNGATLSVSTYDSLLKDIEQPLGLGPGTICLSGHDCNRAYKLASTRYHPPLEIPDICNPPNCAACFRDGETHVLSVPRSEDEVLRVISTPIRDQEQQHGVLLMEIPPDTELEDWQLRLLEAVAHHIGMALNITQRVAESRRLGLLEERSVIARELHDSLAQSLSYLKIQVARLDVTLSNTEGEAAARAIITQLREGVSSAYRQLRELLTTFRLSMEGGGLSKALENTVREFNERGGIEIALDNQLDSYQLSVNEEIHVHQVIREALSNVVQHAQAKYAHVILHSDKNNSVKVIIEDDGKGIPDEAERRHHYGLAIMNERARSLRGQIYITRRPVGGTRVEIVFTPVIHDKNRNTAGVSNL